MNVLIILFKQLFLTYPQLLLTDYYNSDSPKEVSSLILLVLRTGCSISAIDIAFFYFLHYMFLTHGQYESLLKSKNSLKYIKKPMISNIRI